MAELDDLCSLTKLDQEVKVGETEKKDGQKEEESVSEIEEKDLQKEATISLTEEKNTTEEAKVTEMDEKYMEKEAKVSELEEKYTEKEAKVSEMEEKHTEKEAKVSQLEEKYTEKEAKVSEMEEKHTEKVSEMEEKVSETEKYVKVSEIEEIHTEKEAKVGSTEEKIIEEEVSKKKAKVSFKLALGDDGDILSSCSDMSFEVNTDNIDSSAQSDSHGSLAATTRRVKKNRKRQSKGGSRHKKQPQKQRDGVQSQQFSNKAWLAHQKALHLQEKDKAAAATRYSEEQHLVLFPAAPFNSTQYLMEERNKNSPPEDWCVSSASNSPKDQTPMPLSPSETNHEAVQFPKRDQEFTDSLISVRAESFQNIKKELLVENCMHLEDQAAALYKQVAKTENEMKKEQDDEEDVFLTESEHTDRPFMFESVYNSEANSLSSNNEDFVDLSSVNQQPVCVEESSVFTCEKPITPSVSNCSSSESSS